MQVQSIAKPIAKVLGKVQQCKPMERLSNCFEKDFETALAYTTVGSIVVKDGVGCYKYVTQSMHNDKIPEDKRKFVAALDLTNGVLMIAAQIGMFFAMRKFTEPLFNKIFNKSFNPKAISTLISKIRNNAAKAGNDVPRKLPLMKEIKDDVKSASLSVFKFVLELAAATILGKRVIVPFIATPLANVVKDKMDRKASKAGEKSEPAKVEPKAAEPAKAEQAPKLDVVSTETNLLKQYTQQH